MKPKTVKITYWILTGLFCLGMVFSGISGIMHFPSADQVLIDLGYPTYVNTIIGIAKVLGVVAILQWKYKTIKEWAYSGFLIDFIGAGASLYFGGKLANLEQMKIIANTLSVIPFIALMFASYYFWKKKEAI